MGKKSSAKKQGKAKKPQANTASALPNKGSDSIQMASISLQQAIKTPVKHNGLHIDSALYVRKDIRLISYLLIGMFVVLAALTITNDQTGFVSSAGKHLSSFLNF